jgi:outer membrane protein assembly factor BamA
MGILRSANGFRWDSENAGHVASAGVRFGRERKLGLDVQSYDFVDGTESWQLSEPEAGLASFFFHRDYNDYYGRHGGSIAGSLGLGARSRVQLELRDERWASRGVRNVFTIFRAGEPWRDNPRVDDGRVHVGELSVLVDTRNDSWSPLYGWFLNAEYENARGRFDHFGTSSPLARSTPVNPVSYGRVLLDLRRYNRISPTDQVNMRLVLGGWLHGDELPMQRRFSVGGIGTIPGFDYRRRIAGEDKEECGEFPILPGNPAQCERVALLQLEYRTRLGERAIEPINLGRYHGRLVLRPTVVAFFDSGRGWLVGDRRGNLQYPSGSIPNFGTFLTDLGVGFDVGFAGLYVAKAVSNTKEPANIFMRIRRRF